MENNNSACLKNKKTKNKIIKKRRVVFTILVLSIVIFALFNNLSLVNSNTMKVSSTTANSLDQNINLAWKDNVLAESKTTDLKSYNVENEVYGYTNEYAGAYTFTTNQIGSVKNGYYKDGIDDSFNDEGIGTSGTDIKWVDQYTNNPSTIISEWKGHKNCLGVYDNSQSYSYFESQSIGTIEFYADYWKGTDLSYIQFYENNQLSEQLITFNIYEDSDFRIWYGDGAGGITYTHFANNDLFNRFKLVFDCTVDSFTLYMNDILIVSDVPFRNDLDVAGIGAMKINAGDGKGLVIDAVGYSWENGYDVGDNQYQDLLDSEPLPITNYTLPLNSSLQVDSTYKGHDNILNLTSDSDLNSSFTMSLNDQPTVETSFWINSKMNVSDFFYLSARDINNKLIFLLQVCGNGSIYNINYYGSHYELYKYYRNDTWNNFYLTFNKNRKAYYFYINYQTIYGTLPFFTQALTYSNIHSFTISFGKGTFLFDAFDFSFAPDYVYQRSFEPIAIMQEYMQTDNIEFDYPPQLFEWGYTRFEQDDSDTNEVYIDNENGIGSYLMITAKEGSGGSRSVYWNNLNCSDGITKFKMRFEMFNFSYGGYMGERGTLSFRNIGSYWQYFEGYGWYILPASINFVFFYNSTTNKIDFYYVSNYTTLGLQDFNNYQLIKSITPDKFYNLEINFNFQNNYLSVYLYDSMRLNPKYFNFGNNGINYTVSWGNISQVNFALTYEQQDYFRAFEIDSVALKHENGGNYYSNTMFEYSAYSYFLPHWDTSVYNLVNVEYNDVSITEAIADYLSDFPSIDWEDTPLDYFMEMIGAMGQQAYDVFANINEILNTIENYGHFTDWSYNTSVDDDTSDPTDSIPIPPEPPDTYVPPEPFTPPPLQILGNTYNLYTSNGQLQTSDDSDGYNDVLISVKKFNWFAQTPKIKVSGVALTLNGKDYIPQYEYDASSRGGNCFMVVDNQLTWRYSKTHRSEPDESLTMSVDIPNIKTTNNSVAKFTSLMNNGYEGSLSLLDTSQNTVKSWKFNSTQTEITDNITLSTKSSGMKVQTNGSGVISKIVVKLTSFATNLTSYFVNGIKTFGQGLLTAIETATSNKSLYEFEGTSFLNMDFQEALITISVRMLLFFIPAFVGYIFIGRNGIIPFWLLMLVVLLLIGQIPLWMVIIQAIAFIMMFIVPKNESEPISSGVI